MRASALDNNGNRPWQTGCLAVLDKEATMLPGKARDYAKGPSSLASLPTDTLCAYGNQPALSVLRTLFLLDMVGPVISLNTYHTTTTTRHSYSRGHDWI